MYESQNISDDARAHGSCGYHPPHVIADTKSISIGIVLAGFPKEDYQKQ